MDLKTLKIYSDKDFPPYLPKLNSLYDDLFAGGKGLRSKLIQIMGNNLGLDERRIVLLAQTIEFIHNASLLHDDLVDRSALRRNKPTAWLKYTPEYAVLAGDYLLARVMVNLSSHGNLRLVQYTSEIISDLLEGEWIQDSLIKDHNVGIEELDRVHNLKTASLFKWCIRAPFLAAEIYAQELHDLLEDIGTILGQLFQRSDDLLDFDVRNFERKAILGDLKSGYINSFAAFLSKNFNESQRKSLLQSTTMSDIFALLGEKGFYDKVQEFDNINSELLQVFQQHLAQLKSMLPATQQGFISELQKISQLLYWRKVN